MKIFSLALISGVLLAAAAPAPALTPNLPPAPGADGPARSVVPDGIVWHLGRPYLIQNGQATAITQTLVPAGHVLTHDGRLIPLPPDFSLPSPALAKVEIAPSAVIVPPVPVQAAPSGTVAGATMNYQAEVPIGSGLRGYPAPIPAAPAAPYASLFPENSSARRTEPVTYYRPVGAVSPRSGIRTYPGTTAASLTNGSTRVVNGMAQGSTLARVAGRATSHAGRASTKATTVYSR